MKIAIYGTSRSGKDYLIEHASQYLISIGLKVCHLKGSLLLNEMADKFYGMRFSQIEDHKKTVLREKFVRIVTQENASNDVVFVDGHYAFPTSENKHFNVVFTDADRDCYDHFFYLDTKAELILKRFRMSEGEKQNLTITIDDIDDWKSFEKEAMMKICTSLEKELVILDEDTPACIEFITSWVLNFEKLYNFERIANSKIESALGKRRKTPNNALVIDCDNTLSTNDTTFVLCQELGIQEQELKEIYSGDRYTSYQFFKVSRMLGEFSEDELQSAAQKAYDQICLANSIVGFVESNSHEFIVAMTAGLLEIWSHKLLNEFQIDCSFGNTASGFQYVVTPSLKKAVVRALKSRGVKVTAIGDSIIDIPMLEESDIGILVAHSKLNKAVCLYLEKAETSGLMQAFSPAHKYSIPQLDWSN